MMQRVAAALLFGAALECGMFCLAQAPGKTSPDLKFDVVSLKPSPPGGRGGSIRPSPGADRYEANNVPLRLMIQVAYRVKADQVVGGPTWLDTDTFDMQAKAEKPSNVEELHVMLQNLLADRFQLQFHRTAKVMSMYALTVDKAGPKMEAHQAKSAGDPWVDIAQQRVLQTTLTATCVPMDYFAWRLSMLMDLPVVDQTTLKGGYDFKLSYTRDLPPNIPADARINGEQIDTSGPSVFEALRNQLGLKLEKTKGPVEILQIDRVEKPSGN